MMSDYPSGQRQPPAAIAVLGTGSSVGKSLIATGLCRLLARRGLRVAPFKAQNMSNNACVVADGGEIGRAQAVQARACGLEPTVDMNPILLKPEAGGRSQVVLRGQVVAHESPGSYQALSEQRFELVCAAYDRLAHGRDVVVLEGAGSCAELNLLERDIVNFRAAAHADARVVLVGDIERGGVFAQLIGSLSLVPKGQRDRVAGLVVNKFCGDRTLFDDGVRILQERTGVPVLGVIPHLPGLRLDDEDSVDLPVDTGRSFGSGTINIAVVATPHISNTSDFTALAAELDVAVRFVRRPDQLAGADAVILPGSKQTLADMDYLREAGFDRAVAAHNLEVVGICGGFQMLGHTVADPDGVEGGGAREGLGLLDCHTELVAHKITARRQAVAQLLDGVMVNGYEIHCGRTTGAASPAFLIDGQPDGAIGAGGRVWGSYLHGLFEQAPFRRAWLNRLRHAKGLPLQSETAADALDEALAAEIDRWADHLAASLRPDTLELLLGGELTSA